MATRRGTWERSCRQSARITAVLLVSAATGAYGQSWRVTPTVGVSETYSTNMRLAGNDAATEGWISTLSPAIRVAGRGSRVKGYFDYRHDESYYHGLSSANASRNLLSSYATVEAVSDWLFIDGAASVTPRSSSVFSQDATNSSNAVGNQNETRVLQISPYVRGRLLGSTDYLLRAIRIDARSKNETVFRRTQVDRFLGSMRNPAARGSIGWFMDGNGSRVENDSVGKRTDDRIRGGVILPTLPHLNMLAFAGRERTDISTTGMETYSTSGLGFEWRPSEHTQAVGMSEKRFFGRSHDVFVMHRTPFTAWRYSDVKDVALLPMGLAGFNRGSVYDLMSDLLTVSITDPVAREEAARARVDQVGGGGAAADVSGVLVSRIFLDRTRQASLALLGRRSVVTVMLQQRDERLLLEPTPSTVQDDFALSPEIRDRNLFLSWIYRLTPIAELNVSTNYGKRYGLSVPDLEATQRSAVVALTSRLTAKTRVAVAVRGSNFSRLRGGDSVHERALVGTLTQSF